LSQEFSFPHRISVLVPHEVVDVQVDVLQETPEVPVKIGFQVPVGISEQAMCRLALQYYDLAERAARLAEDRWVELEHERKETGIAGTEPEEEAS